MIVLEKNRNKYWKRKKGKSCDFCNLKVIKEQAIKKLAGKYWHVWANKFPYLDGNLMLIPKRHVENLESLNEKEKTEFFQVLEKSKQILGKLFKTKSFNIALNLGPDSGASIKHLHWQIVPRRKMNPNTLAVFNDFHLVTLDYKDLIRMIGKLD